MDLLQAIVLGIVQGLTEFLPISSSGHLRIVPAFAGWKDPGAAFTAVIQLGTMAAVLLYFRSELWRIARAWVRSVRAGERRPADQDARLGWYILLGTIPIAILGVAFSDPIENLNVATAVDEDLAANHFPTLSEDEQVDPGPRLGHARTVRVQLKSTPQLPFMSIFTSRPATLTADATAMVDTGGSYCMIALDDSDKTGIHISGNSVRT